MPTERVVVVLAEGRGLTHATEGVVVVLAGGGLTHHESTAWGWFAGGGRRAPTQTANSGVGVVSAEGGVLTQFRHCGVSNCGRRLHSPPTPHLSLSSPTTLTPPSPPSDGRNHHQSSPLRATAPLLPARPTPAPTLHPRCARPSADGPVAGRRGGAAGRCWRLPYQHGGRGDGGGGQ